VSPEALVMMILSWSAVLAVVVFCLLRLEQTR
jgi:hypothetical protein